MAKQKYINREVSWLEFNARVLQEAKDENVPLIERMKFLGIYSNNLDEFYAVRYATIVRAIQLETQGYNNIVEDQSNEDLLEEVNQIVTRLQIEYRGCYNDIKNKLAKENIFIVDDTNILDEHKSFIQNFYDEELNYSTSVLILNKKRGVPDLKNGELYLVVKMELDDKNTYALIEIPTDTFPRFIELPKIDGKNYVIYLEDIIRYYLKHIFRNFKYDHIEAHGVKITRDAQLDMDNDVKHSFLEKIAKSVEGRKKGQPVRIAYDRNIANDTIKYLKKSLKFDDYDSLVPGVKYHNKKDLIKFPDFGRKDLRYKKINPIKNQKFYNASCYFDAFSKSDHLIYAPYHDYSILLKFLHEAAMDPLVKSIKLTVYRAANKSKIMRSLINAARNGKEVTAVLELRARFDEKNNVDWSKKLQDEGVNVVFGVPNLKVHSKIIQVSRKSDGDKAKLYSVISTGNFNEATANIYTDFTLITSHKEINKEVRNLFEFFDANYLVKPNEHLMISPLETRNQISALIDNEIQNKKNGLPAQINIKVNSCSDKGIIDKLYEASQAGVEVRMVVRGIHSLIDGLEDISENIKSISIVDKFLEHPRMYWFKNAGNDIVYISSADLMPRNIDHRIELSVPIYDADLKKIIMTIFDLNFMDNIKARTHHSGNQYANQNGQNGSWVNRSQIKIYDFLSELNEN